MKTEKFIDSIGESNGVYVPKYKYFKIAESFVKMYTERGLELSKLFAQLTQSEIVVLMFLVEDMRVADNEVYTSKNVIVRFINEMAQVGKNYQVVTVKRAFQKLKEMNILLPVPDTRGVYKINPAFIYKDVETKRHELFKIIRKEQTASLGADPNKEIL